MKRLAERGWEHHDLSHQDVTNHALMKSKKIPTERTWTKLCSTLEDVLRRVRDERLAKERYSVLDERYVSLAKIFGRFRKTLFPEGGNRVVVSPGDYIRLCTEDPIIDKLIWETPFDQTVSEQDILKVFETVDFRGTLRDWCGKRERDLDALLRAQDVPVSVDLGTAIFKVPIGPEGKKFRGLIGSDLLSGESSALDDSPVPWQRPEYNPYIEFEIRPSESLEDSGIVYDSKASWYARQMVEMFNTKDIRNVRERNPLFECLSCSKETQESDSGRPRILMRCLQVLSHVHANHDLSVDTVNEGMRAGVEQTEADMREVWKAKPDTYPPSFPVVRD
ncbi:hypothetical protein V5O48_017950 [Marasmius crinis-equi]|uniref:Uncharacterized protein n=1 Tax=Marasmius crinis-equi TaxID=585013 RepID=A0ABR3EMK2_9AGAR